MEKTIGLHARETELASNPNQRWCVITWRDEKMPIESGDKLLDRDKELEEAYWGGFQDGSRLGMQQLSFDIQKLLSTYGNKEVEEDNHDTRE